jgi:epoxide hydrolase-like predicted phosphatase
MTSTRLVDGVVFDFGGVLTTPVRDSIDAWLAADGIEPASFSRTLKSWMSRDVSWNTPVHRLEVGELSAEEFGRLLVAELTSVDGRSIDPSGVLDRLFAQMRPDPEMFALVDDLRELGIRVGLLSNSWGNTYPRERIEALFDPVVISGEVGLRKPQASIYEHTLGMLGLPPGLVLFVDDAEPNIVGARAVGMRALLHTEPRGTRAALAALIPELSPTRTGVIA